MINESLQAEGLSDLHREKCGVFAVANVSEASKIAYFGIFALQHRGQEGAGIVSSDGKELSVYKGPGLVNQVFLTEDQFDLLPGKSAIGHVRYGTSRPKTDEGPLEHIQPVVRRDRQLALAHNGNLPNVKDLRKYLEDKGISTNRSTDSEMMADAIRFNYSHGASIDESVAKVYSLFKGSFSTVLQTPNKIAAFRDECGIRPLSFGKLNGGYVFASETCAFDLVGAELIRDVKPGELMVIDQNNEVSSYQLAPARRRYDAFEYVYFARPDSILNGIVVEAARRNLGANLYREFPLDADYVIPVPDSGVAAAEGLSHISGIPVRSGLIKNRYVGRTFITPSQIQREQKVDMKLSPVPEVLKGKRVILVDDSIVRGTTMARISKKVRQAGAAEVLACITSPEIYFPNFLGMDTARQDELIAFKQNLSERLRFMGLDGLYHLSLQGMANGIGLSLSDLCVADFNGDYPIDIGERAVELKYLVTA